MSEGLSREHGFPVVDLEGSPRERGLAHGRALRARIARSIERWSDEVAATTGRPLAQVIREFCATTSFVPAIERWTPDLLEEIRGIAAGADIDFETILACNFLDEWGWFAAERYRGDSPETGCSVIGLRYAADGHPVAAQTHDLSCGYEGVQAILRIRGTDGIRVLAFTAAGMIALSGCNDRGVSVNCNGLARSLPHSGTGLPVAFIVRGVLACSTMAEARNFLERVPHASGQNYLLGGPEGVLNLECSAERVAEAGGGAVVLHTNHPLVQPDGSPASRQRAVANSRARLEYLESCAPGLRSVQEVQRALENPAVCKREAEHYTAAAITSELSVPPRVFITAGPPDEHPWRQVSFTRKPP